MQASNFYCVVDCIVVQISEVFAKCIVVTSWNISHFCIITHSTGKVDSFEHLYNVLVANRLY